MKVLDIITESTSWTSASPFTAFLANNHVRAQRYERIMMRRWGWKVFGFLKIAGIAGPSLQFAQHLIALEDVASNDALFTELTGEPIENRPRWIEKTRGLIWAQFSAQILVPAVWTFSKRLPVVAQLLGILAGTAGAVFGRRGQAFVIGVRIVEQSAMTAFMVWLGTEQGAKWLSDNIFVEWFMRQTGQLEAGAWDKIYDKFFEITGVAKPEKSNVDKEIEKANGPADAGPTSDQIAQWEKDSQARTNPNLTVPAR